MRLRAGVELAAAGRQRGAEDLALAGAERVSGDDLHFGTRLQHERLAGLADEVSHAASGDRGGGEIALHLVLPELLAGERVVTGGDARHVEDGEVRADGDR